ncbi:MAG: triphosphoribosyl-dephospho-CoA synthase [Gammaproteobacteria bacterium]|nr:MAG: triphosphoribosyl-dephospho-CoA synthase [Gammaproteobacteria bacterium]
MLSKQQIQKCIIWACEQEVLAPKPGNVNGYNDGHNMQVQDFIKSAHAIAPALTTEGASVGHRILLAMQATQQVVNCNTNLGIVLLFSPLCVAIEQCDNFQQLDKFLRHTLNNLTIEDAEDAYQAIRLAHAGGLGQVEKQDISQQPTITLLEAMRTAKDRDTIAAQYLNNYREIIEIGLENLTISINSGESVEWATTFAYLCLLSDIEDTLIHRKQGAKTARIVSEKATYILDKHSKNNMLKELSTELEMWDKELKGDAINPGTTADLTASTLLLRAFQDAFNLTVFRRE